MPESSETSAPLSSTRIVQCNFSWETLDGSTFSQLMSNIYNDMVYSKRIIFLVPSGAVGKEFVIEVALLFQAYADESSFESVAMKACMVMQVLMLQTTGP